MGWWSAEILGGDTPLDAIDVIAEGAGTSFNEKFFNLPDEDGKFNKHGYSIVGKDVARNFENIESLIRRDFSWKEHQRVALQVMGYILIETKTPIPANAYRKIYDAIIEDDWAAEGDDERLRVIQDFSNKLLQHMRDYK